MSLFNKVKIKVKAKRNVSLTNRKYSLKNKERSAVVVGNRLVSVGGQLFESNFSGNIGDTVTVTNVGTPAAALYAQSTTGAVSSSTGGSGNVTVVSDGALATIQAHIAQGDVEGHATSPASREFYSIKYSVVGGTDVDESANIGAMFHTVGSNGGGKCIIASVDGVSPIRLDDLAGIYHSNMDIEFRSPIISGAGGGVRAMGAMDEYVRAPATFGAGLHASHPANVGDTTITLSSTAGKMQASDFLPGDLVTIRGENNAKGEALTKQIITILSVNAGANTITFAEELEYDFEPTYPLSAYGSTDATTIFLNRTWALTADLVRGAMTATVSDSTGMAVGDMVRVSDSRVEIDLNPAAYRSGGAGPYENECRLEYRIITYIDTGTDTVTFDKPISKGYLQGSPYFGNLAKVLPVENVHIRGINLTYHEAQTDRNIHAISLNFAKDSTIEDCQVNGIDGGMGQQYRISDSYNCWGYRSIGRDPLYHDSAEGYIFALYKSDASGWRHCLASGGRHNFLVQAATNYTIDSCQSYDSWISGIDTHGVDEYDGLITNCLMSQMNKHAPTVSNGACLRIGNTSHTVGSHWTVVQNCVFFGNPETSIYGLDFLAASTHLIVDSCKFFGGDYGIRNSKNPSQCDPTQTASDITIRDCEFHNITVRAVYLEGIPDTATNTRSSGKLNYVLLDGNTTWNCAQHFHVSGGDAITNLTVSRNRAIRPVTSPGNDYYGLVITDVDGLMVDNNNFHLCSRGISLTDATNAAIIGNTLTATVDAIPITLAGTNTGPGGGALIYVANIVDNGSLIGSTSFTTDASVSSAIPRYIWIETDAAVDNRRWDVAVNGGIMYFRAVNDANTTAANWMTIGARSGNVISAIAIAATSLNLTGAMTLTGAFEASSTLAGTGAITAKGAAAALAMHNRSTNALSISLYSPTAGDFRIYDHVAGINKLVIDASHNAAFAGNVAAAGNVTSTGAAGGLILWNRTGTSAPSGEWYSPTAGDVHLYNYALVADQIIAASSGLVTMAYDFAVGGSTDLALGTSTNGALMVHGTTQSSHFNYGGPSGAQDTYIRGGKSTSDVFIGDAGSGDVTLGQSGAGVVTAAGNMTVAGTLTTSGPVTDGNGGFMQHVSFGPLTPGTVLNILPNNTARAAGVTLIGNIKHSVIANASAYASRQVYSGFVYDIAISTDTLRFTCTTGGKVTATHYAGSSGNISGSIIVMWAG
jgi:hypothetical protein